MSGKQWGKASILGCFVDLVNMEQALRTVEDMIGDGVPCQVITLNAELVYNAYHNRYLQEIINSARLVTPDGVGIVWAARRLGYRVEERVTGIDMFYNLCKLAAEKGWGVYFLGAAPGVAKKAGEKLASMYPGLNISGNHHGFFNDEENKAIIDEIKSKSPELLFVAMGAPKQEYWINRMKDELGVPVCMGVGGSFDVVAGIKKRAPNFIIKLNLEWFYRLITEPVRFKRQLALPKFVLLILKQKYLRRKREDVKRET